MFFRAGRQLDGRVAAITGAARGIGRATAVALVAEGMQVAIGDLDGEEAFNAASAIGPRALAFELDVTDRDSFAGFLADAERALGPLDVLVNNAGIMPIGHFVDLDPRLERGMLDVNVGGVLTGMKLALPKMLARRSGHVVNLASTAGRVGVPGGAVYCGTKHFVYGLSEAVRAELRGTGVEISCVMPGKVRTELTAGLHDARMLPTVEPADVAAAIVATLRRPRFDVYVPRRIGPSITVGRLLPRRSREALGRALGADRFLFDYDPSDRRAYEERAKATALRP
jgi:NADP-dependent 3-hydroxy acid dehydrogenase YdfG